MTLPDALKSDRPLRWSTGRGTEVWALFQACMRGDEAAVRRLLDGDPTLVRCHFQYRTPLYFAVRENRLPIVALLIERGGDPLSLAVDDALIEVARDRGYVEMERWLRVALDRRFEAGGTGEEVASAIRERDLGKVSRLLDASPGVVHAGDRRSNQAIHWAVMTRHLGMIDLVLARGGDIHARRFDGARPIHLTNGDYFYRGWRDVPDSVTTTPDEVYRHLVARGAEVDLGMAAAKGDLARVRALLDRDPTLVNRVSEYNSYYVGCGAPLKNAAATGQIEVVRLLLERGADPNLPEEGIAPDGHALYSAVANGHFEIVQCLLEHGAKPNAEVESSADALSRAISNGDSRMIDLLCSWGASRPVHLLAHYGDLRTAAAVFAANPAMADDPEALESAGSAEFVRLMLRHQPDLPKRVATAKDRETTELLFRHGMDANRRNWMGISPLHEFARRGDVESAALFLRHGADLHARDGDLQSTPLAYAAKFGQVTMVEFLLRCGARVRLPDDPRWATPMAWAERRGHDEVARILRHHAQWGVLPRRRTLRDDEAMAVDWSVAYATGDSEALNRIALAGPSHRKPTQDQVRERIRRQYRHRVASEELPLAEAQEWVAAMQGFESWHALEQHRAILARDDQRVAMWMEVDRAILDGDADALENHMRVNAEWLKHRPKGAYPACVASLDFSKSPRDIVIREHGFRTWDEFTAFQDARRTDGTATAMFEDAVEAVVAGEVERLRQRLAANPELVRMRSSRTHGATLLHYVGANGVEAFRQRTPPNAVHVAELLLASGSDVNAVASMYGGSTVLGLVATSVHPWLAGVQMDLLRTLLAHGASIDPPPGAGHTPSPVVGCLANGRQEAAVFLATQGASLNLESAAGVGRLDLVKAYVGESGELRLGATDAELQSGFQWACQYGHVEVVACLVDRGVDVRRLHRGQTGLHWAAYGGHGDIVQRLLEKGAPVDVVDTTYRTTPLGWALYGWSQPPPGSVLQRYPEVVSQLIGRGAVVRPEWRQDARIQADVRMRKALNFEAGNFREDGAQPS